MSTILNSARLAEKYIGRVRSFRRLLMPRALGLKCGSRINIGENVYISPSQMKSLYIGDDVVLGSNSRLYISPEQSYASITISKGVNIGDGFYATAFAPLYIGKECLISFRVSILTNAHGVGAGVDPRTSQQDCGAVTIGERCFIGCNVTIMPRVCLGDNCVVGANSVVTKSFPPNSVIAGCPARLIKTLK